MRYLWLTASILFEVLATSSLKASEGFTRLVPSLLVVFGYGTAFYCLSQTIKSLPIGIVYAIWSGVGTVLIALIGSVVYKQTLDKPAIFGMALVVLGVVMMNVFSRSSTH